MHSGRPIVVADDDLLFSSRIASTLTRLGHRPLIVRTEAAFQDALGEQPGAAVLNLAAFRLDAVAAIRRAKANPMTRTIPLLGFCGHADLARQTAARDAGCDLVASNGEVTGNLPKLLGALLAKPSSPPGR